jgi:hypothetical protein
MLHAIGIAVAFFAIFIFAILAGGGVLGDIAEKIANDDRRIEPDEHKDSAI